MDLTKEDAARLREWLRANAEAMASELREAGWEEDAPGLWRYLGRGKGYHLYDAHEVLRRQP